MEFGLDIEFLLLVTNVKHFIRPLCNVFLFFAVMIHELVDGGGELLGF